MKVRLALLGAMIIVVAACGNAYEGQPVTYHPVNANYVKPRVWGMNMRQVEVDNGIDNARCVIGLTAAGTGAIASVAAAPAGLTAWVLFGAAGSGWGLGETLSFCYDTYNAYRDVFDVFTSCPVNKPILESTFDDYMSAIAFINLNSCWCSFSCQIGFDDPTEVDPRLKFWQPLMGLSTDFHEAKNNYHDGPNRLPGLAVVPDEPIDYNTIANSLGMEYTGCDGVGVFKDATMEPLC